MKKATNASIMENSTGLHAIRTEDLSAVNHSGDKNFSLANEFSYNFRELLEKLRAPLGELVKQRIGWTDRSGKGHFIEYLEWHTVADVLDQAAPDWSYTIRSLQQIGDLIAVTAAITINGITREGVGTGPAASEMGIKKAESDALKRAARMFGIGRDLYKDLDEELSARQTAIQNNESTAVETKSNTRELPNFQFDPLAYSNDDLVTPRQLVALRAIANSMGMEAEAECQRLLKCDIKEISRRAASTLIDHLKTRAIAARA